MRARAFDVGAAADDAEHAPAGRAQRPVRGARRARMKAMDVSIQRRETVDVIAGARRARVSRRRGDDTNRSSRRRCVPGCETSVRCVQQRVEHLFFDDGQDHLRLRVAETRVELQHARTRRREHDSGVEATDKRRPHIAKGIDTRLQHGARQM